MFNLAIGVLGVVFGALCTILWNMIQTLRASHEALRENVVTNYVRRDDYREDITELKSMLRDIMTKLDTKADKT